LYSAIMPLFFIFVFVAAKKNNDRALSASKSQAG
jgi:hypothetical protein